MQNIIPYGKQEIDDTDIKSVIDVLKSDFLTQGSIVPNFEKHVSAYCGAKFAVAVNSATSALHIACMTLDLCPGDILWTSPNTFVASSNCALYCGASVDFVDIDPLTYNISIKKLEEKLIEAEIKGKLPKIIIPVHFSGQSCDMKSIYNLSLKYKFKIIEDASHAIGGEYLDMLIGNCSFSDITIFSFHPVKIITTGEGGMLLTNNIIDKDAMLKYRSHGITNKQSEMQIRDNDEIWNYQQLKLGFNYRMTDIQAALGISQLNKLSKFIEIRHKIAKRYDSEFANLNIIIPYNIKESKSSYHLYTIRLTDKSNISQLELYNYLISEDILVNLHYIPVYRQPFYEKLGFEKGYCEEAEKYFKQILSIPIYTSLKYEEQTKVINCIKKVVTKKTI